MQCNVVITRYIYSIDLHPFYPLFAEHENLPKEHENMLITMIQMWGQTLIASYALLAISSFCLFACSLVHCLIERVDFMFLHFFSLSFASLPLWLVQSQMAAPPSPDACFGGPWWGHGGAMAGPCCKAAVL